MNEITTLPQALAAARKAAGLTQVEVCARMGASYNIITKLEKPSEFEGLLLTLPRWKEVEAVLGHHLADVVQQYGLEDQVLALPEAVEDERTITRTDRREHGLSQRVRELRKQRGLAQDEIGVGQGLNKAQVGRIERATTTPTTQDLRALAAFFGVSYAYLLDGEEQQTDRERKLNDQVAALQAKIAHLHRFIKHATDIDPNDLSDALKG